MAKYLVSYEFGGGHGHMGYGDATVNVGRLTPRAIDDIKRWLRDDLRQRISARFGAAIGVDVVILNIIRLEEEGGK